MVKGPFVPMKIVPESVEYGVVVPQGLNQKDPSEFTNTENNPSSKNSCVGHKSSINYSGYGLKITLVPSWIKRENNY